MNYYGDVALGVECALPPEIQLLRPPGHARQFMTWFIGAFTRRS